MRRWSRFAPLLLTCAGLAGCGASTPQEGVAEIPSRALARELADARVSAHAPGAAAVIVERGRVVWSGAGGLADIPTRRPMTVRTPVYFASVSKMITAAVALRAQEQGLLRLDDPVRRWVPQWKGPHRVTLRSLLSHTSGIHDPGQSFFDAMQTGRSYTPRDWLARLPAPDRHARPAFEYANANYILAGLAIRRAAGRHWDALRHEVAPGLALQPDDRVAGPAVTSYIRSQSIGGAPKAFEDGSGYVPTRAFVTGAWTAGAWAGTPEQLALWANRLYTGKILDAASLREMTTFAGSADGDSTGYALAIRRDHLAGEEVWTHDGAAPGTHTELWHVPRSGLTVFVVWNTDLYSDEATLPTRLLSLVGFP